MEIKEWKIYETIAGKKLEFGDILLVQDVIFSDKIMEIKSSPYLIIFDSYSVCGVTLDLKYRKRLSLRKKKNIFIFNERDTKDLIVLARWKTKPSLDQIKNKIKEKQFILGACYDRYVF